MRKEKSEAYARRRPVADGMFAGATDAIGDNMFWNTLNAAQPDLVLPGISRKWAHGAGWVPGRVMYGTSAELTRCRSSNLPAACVAIPRTLHF